MKEDLKVVLLFRCYHVYQFFKGPVLMTGDSRPDILGEVEGCAVASQEDLLVQVYLRKIHPNRTILFFVKTTAFQALEHLFPSATVGFTLIVKLVKTDACVLVGRINSIDGPSIHPKPELGYLGNTLFPILKHPAHLRIGGFIFF